MRRRLYEHADWVVALASVAMISATIMFLHGVAEGWWK